MDKFWTSFGHILDKFWTSFGQLSFGWFGRAPVGACWRAMKVGHPSDEVLRDHTGFIPASPSRIEYAHELKAQSYAEQAGGFGKSRGPSVRGCMPPSGAKHIRVEADIVFR